MTGSLWFLWSICALLSFYFAVIDEIAAQAVFVAASIVILAIGEKK